MDPESVEFSFELCIDNGSEHLIAMSLPLINPVSEVSTDTDLVEDSCYEGRTLGTTSIEAMKSTLLSEAIIDLS